MASGSQFKRYCVEAQGFVGYDDAKIDELDKWLRLSTGICVAWAAVGTYMASWQVILAMVPFAFFGAILSGHPFDVFYNNGLRHMVNGDHFPPSPSPRRFACAVATVWLLVNAYAFYAGAMTVGYALGIAFVITASSPTFIGFCVPSFFYGLLFGSPVEKYRKEQAEKAA
jgi:hypothetical protein